MRPRTVWFIAFLVATGAAALNVGVYASSHKPINLGAAIFCGLLAVYDGIQASKE